MMLTNKTIAVIIPVYNEKIGLRENFIKIVQTLKEDKVEAHYLLIDDGSTDGTWDIISQLSVEYTNLHALRFAKNFGKEMAICAGIEEIDADLYVIMDSDLQHPPKVVSKMIDKMFKEGANIVSGVKENRGTEGLLNKAIAKSFYGILRMITHLEMQNSSDFKVIDRSVVNELRRFQERNLFFRGLVDWVGFKKVELYFNVEDRLKGTSRFSFIQLVKLAINAIIAYTSKPLYLIVLSGLIFSIFAVILGIQTLINYFSGNALDGFSTVILILLITGSMIMFSLGIIGTYISRIYDEIKARPRYIIRDKF